MTVEDQDSPVELVDALAADDEARAAWEQTPVDVHSSTSPTCASRGRVVCVDCWQPTQHSGQRPGDSLATFSIQARPRPQWTSREKAASLPSCTLDSALQNVLSLADSR